NEIVRTLIAIGNVYLDLGDSKQALNYAQMAWTATMNSQDPEAAVEALVTLGTVLLRQGKATGALESANKALEIGSATLSPAAQAEALWLIGLTHYESGNYDKAADAFQKARAISQTLGNRAGLARIDHYLAGIDSVMSRPDSALERGRQSLSIFK